MTAKQRLLQLVGAMPESEAEQALSTLEQHGSNGTASEVVRPENGSERAPTDFDALLAFSDEVARNASEEDRKRVPPDLGENLDHYIYGTPKRNPTA